MQIRSWLLAGLLIGAGWADAGTANIGSVQTEIDELSADAASFEPKDAIQRYHVYKAKMWLAYAQHEYAENSLTVAGKEALQQAQVIMQSLKAEQPLTLTMPILSVSQVMRRDLWQQIEWLKEQDALAQAPESVAHAEVMLVWAAAEYCEMGWRHANEHFRAAEQALHQAAEQSNLSTVNTGELNKFWPTLAELNGRGCRGVNSDYWPMLKKTAIDLPQVVHNVVHFASNSAVLSAASQTMLHPLADVLKQQPLLDVELLGYTDRRASEAYNFELAQRRINAVQQYLMMQGVNVQRIKSVAKGAQAFETDVDEKIAQAKSRRVVIQLSDDRELRIEPQWQDLQVESDAQKVKVK